MKIDPNILALIQNQNSSEKLANRQIGCFLAWNEGFGTMDIFNFLLEEDIGKNDIKQWKVGNYILQIGWKNIYSIKTYRKIALKTVLIISEIKNNEVVILHKITTDLEHFQSEYKKIENFYKHTFMEYVLSEI